jgi:hypothetical protein
MLPIPPREAKKHQASGIMRGVWHCCWKALFKKFEFFFFALK